MEKVLADFSHDYHEDGTRVLHGIAALLSTIQTAPLDARAAIAQRFITELRSYKSAVEVVSKASRDVHRADEMVNRLWAQVVDLRARFED